MKMKKSRWLILVLFLFVVCVPFFVGCNGCAGEAGVVQLQFLRPENSNTEWEVRVRFGTYANGVVVLPSEHRGQPVTGIASPGFRGATHFIAVTIPSSITRIATDAFRNTPNLTVIMQSTVPPSQDNSFAGLTANIIGVKAIIVPDSALETYKTEWSQYASRIYPASMIVEENFLINDDGYLVSFFGWQGQVVVPASATSTASAAFTNNQSITKITFHQNIKAIAPDGIKGTSELTNIAVSEANELFASVNGILYDKAKMNMLYIPSKLGGAVVIPEGFVPITGTNQYNINYHFSDAARAQGYFSGTLITSITFPTTYTNIFPEFLKDCSQLTTVVLNQGLTRIGAHAFANASKLTTITIPSTVTFIGADAFLGCNSLTIRVSLAENEVPEGWETNWHGGRPIVWNAT